MRVLRRQATFWELGDDFPTVRIDFPRGSERRFDPAPFADFAIVDTHPVLNEYDNAWSRLSPVAPASEPDAALAAVVVALSADLPWRSADRYLNPQFDPERTLADGYGHLLEAPAPSSTASVSPSPAGASRTPASRAARRVPRPAR